MARAEKTIYYAWATGSAATGEVPSNVLFQTIASMSISIPENSISTPVTISSAYIDTFIRDSSTATGTDLRRPAVIIRLSGSSPAVSMSVSESGFLANTGENYGGILGPWLFTNYFTQSYSNFSSSLSHSIEVFHSSSAGTFTGLRGVNGMLGLTYQYDTSAVTQSKSVIIPLYTRSGSLFNTANSLFAKIPILLSSSEDYLVEASCSVQQYFIVLEGNTSHASALDISCSWAIDSGTPTVLPTQENALTSDTWVRYIIPFTSASMPNLNTTHSLNLWADRNTIHHNLTAKLYITYHYIPSQTTRFLNSWRFALELDSPITGGALVSTASCNTFERTIIVPEPAPITLKNSGVELYFQTAAAPSISIRAVSQSVNRVYESLGGVMCGMNQIMHGLTSGSYYFNPSISNETFCSFSGGENPFKIYLHRTNVNNPTNVSGYCYLNYLSATASQGIHTHTQTRELILTSMSLATPTEFSQLFTPNLVQLSASQNWWLAAVGVENSYWDANAINYLATDVSIGVSESINVGNPFSSSVGMRRLYGDVAVKDSELAYGRWVVRARTDFKRHPRDVDSDRLIPSGSRRWRTVAAAAIRYGNKFFASYHQISGSISGSVTGSGGGSLSLELFKSSTDEIYDRQTRTGDGNYEFRVYDPYSEWYVIAYENAVYKGRSKRGIAGSGGFLITMNTGSGGAGPAAYTEHWF